MSKSDHLESDPDEEQKTWSELSDDLESFNANKTEMDQCLMSEEGDFNRHKSQGRSQLYVTLK